jgi:hypothetical protein
MQVELIKENPDGSADFRFDMTDEEQKTFIRLGILTALKAAIEDAKNLDPDNPAE